MEKVQAQRIKKAVITHRDQKVARVQAQHISMEKATHRDQKVDREEASKIRLLLIPSGKKEQMLIKMALLTRQKRINGITVNKIGLM